MARRSDSTPQELQERVLAQTRAMLEDIPAAQISLREVARRAGYSAGALVHSFGSWNYLLLRVNAETLDELALIMNQVLQGVQDPKQALCRIAQAYLDFALTHRNRWRLIFEHKLGPGEPLPDWHGQRIQRLFALLERRLAELNPAAAETEIRKTARVLWGGVHGITLLSVDEKLFAEPEIHGRDLIQSLLSHYLRSWTTRGETASPDSSLA